MRWVLLGLVVLAAAVAGTLVLGGGLPGSDDPGAAASEQPPSEDERSTAEVARRDLVENDELSGALGFGTSRTVTAAAEGVVTEVPHAGTVINVGEALFD